MVTYQTAYLKTHYPAEFMAAQLSCEAGNTDKITLYISECRDMGIQVLPPHVNESFQDFHVVGGKIIFGLGAVKNVGENAVTSILEARQEGGPFCTLQDFTRRVDLRKVNKKVIESLIKCGAFDRLGPSRRAMIEALDAVLEQSASFQREKNEGQFNLFATECVPGPNGNLTDTPVPDLSEWDTQIKLAHEKEIMGFYVTGHPLMEFGDLIKRFTNANSETLAQIPASAQARLAGLVGRIKEITTKKGDRMAFVSLEDLKGVTELTVFSDLYRTNLDLLHSGKPLIVSGTREGDKEAPKMLANEMHPLEEAPRHFGKGLRITLSTVGTHPHQIKDLKAILTRHRGRIPVKLHVVIPNKTETVINLASFACDGSEALLTEVQSTFGYQPITFD
jgi:DNA polymerase-3 subunit alpha